MWIKGLSSQDIASRKMIIILPPDFQNPAQTRNISKQCSPVKMNLILDHKALWFNTATKINHQIKRTSTQIHWCPARKVKRNCQCLRTLVQKTEIKGTSSISKVHWTWQSRTWLRVLSHSKRADVVVPMKLLELRLSTDRGV